jgi:ribosomal protein L40E
MRGGGYLVKITKLVTTQKEETDKVICNKCGREINKYPVGYLDTFFSAQKTWGYGTGYDSETHSFDICAECYAELVSQFKIPITIIDGTEL